MSNNSSSETQKEKKSKTNQNEGEKSNKLPKIDPSKTIAYRQDGADR